MIVTINQVTLFYTYFIKCIVLFNKIVSKMIRVSKPETNIPTSGDRGSSLLEPILYYMREQKLTTKPEFTILYFCLRMYHVFSLF